VTLPPLVGAVAVADVLHRAVLLFCVNGSWPSRIAMMMCERAEFSLHITRYHPGLTSSYNLVFRNVFWVFFSISLLVRL
jgi:hypothetical protein